MRIEDRPMQPDDNTCTLSAKSQFECCLTWSFRKLGTPRRVGSSLEDEV